LAGEEKVKEEFEFGCSPTGWLAKIVRISIP
jgi:hypothetical protein